MDDGSAFNYHISYSRIKYLYFKDKKLENFLGNLIGTAELKILAKYKLWVTIIKGGKTTKLFTLLMFLSCVYYISVTKNVCFEH